MKQLIYAVMGLTLTLAGCGGGTSTGNPAIEDSSSSGVAASSIGGALSGSNSGGSLASISPLTQPTLLASVCHALDFLPEALASGTCPTFKTAQGSGCTAAGGTLWLSYGSCSFGSSSALWNGTQALIMSSGSANCGSFPHPGASNNLVRQFVSAASSTTPSSVSVTTRYGTTSTIDDASSNLQNFNGDTITPIANGGYGTRVNFNALGARSAVTVAHRVSVAGGMDHSVSGQVTISEASGALNRSLSGSVKVYHNLLKVLGTSTFNSVIHSDTCCLPVSGSITTVFAAGSNVQPTAAGSTYVGKSETLTFTGCGTASLQAIDGTTSDVSLSRCY
jgi:hypothetical protein